MQKCIQCPVTFKIKNNKKFCSERCAINNYRQRKRAKDRFNPKICRKCKKEFVSKFAHLSGKPSKILGFYCSDECKKSSLRAQEARNAHMRRGKLKGGDFIDLYELADKKNWICWICNSKISKDAKHERHNINLYGPSIDHILPLSKGGKHIWENVELAHVLCNSLRGNKELIA